MSFTLSDAEKALAVKSKLSGQLYIGQLIEGRDTQGRWIYRGNVDGFLSDGTVRTICTGGRSIWFNAKNVRPAQPL